MLPYEFPSNNTEPMPVQQSASPNMKGLDQLNVIWYIMDSGNP